jgi:hypothetical protein
VLRVRAPRCVDCLAEGTTTSRPVTGKRVLRCATHVRAVKKAARVRQQATRRVRVYGLTAEQYDAIKKAQGGKCAICQVATGASKALAVDHDHACCPGQVSCGRCVRGLLCSICNRLLGHSRDNQAMFFRAIAYLNHPPAKRVL